MYLFIIIKNLKHSSQGYWTFFLFLLKKFELFGQTFVKSHLEHLEQCSVCNPVKRLLIANHLDKSL